MHKEYDCWLIWQVSEKCNFNCKYCWVISRSTGKIYSIDIKKLMNTLNKTKKIFYITIVGGGEPFLVPNIITATKELTKKHYLSIYSNLISPRIKEFSEKINPERVIYFNASLHLEELESKKMLDKFIRNFKYLEKKGFNVHAIEVAYPPLSKKADYYKKLFKQKGINISFTPFVGKYNEKKYPESYTDSEKNAFSLSDKMLNIYHVKNKLCNAGYNAAEVDQNGDIRICKNFKKNLGNIYSEINLNNTIIKCPYEICECPYFKFNDYLYLKALKENKGRLTNKHYNKTFLKINNLIGLIGLKIGESRPKIYCKLKKTKEVLIKKFHA